MTPSPPTLLDSDHVYIVCPYCVSTHRRNKKHSGTHHIQQRLRQITVQLRQTIRELGHIHCNQLVRILYSVIQRGNAIKRQLAQVLVMDMVCEPRAVLQAQLGLVPRQHRVGKCGRHRNHHPPQDAHHELLPVALDQRLHDGAVHGRDLEGDQRAHDQEHAVADEQARLLATPAGHDDAEEAQQGAEELAVEFDLPFLLGLLGSVVVVDGGGGLGLGALAARGGLLLGDGIAHAVDERDEQSEVDGARDAGSVGEVEGGEVGDDCADCAIALAGVREGGEEELGLGSHCKAGVLLSVGMDRYCYARELRLCGGEALSSVDADKTKLGRIGMALGLGGRGAPDAQRRY